MSTPSVVRAVQLRVATFTAANFPSSTVPPLYFDKAPTVDGSGNQVQPSSAGYGVIKHKAGQTKAMTFGLNTKEDHELEIAFFYPSLGDAQVAVNAARLNGGTQSQKAGLDYGTLPDLASPYSLFAMRPLGDEPGGPEMGKTGSPVHSWVVRYRVELIRSAS